MSENEPIQQADPAAPPAPYSWRLGSALAYACALHAGQLRKGKPEHYISHPLRVTSLVIRYGGNEDQMVAGALHDVAEDAGGEPRAVQIGQLFGAKVETIVRDCSDSLVEDPEGKKSWGPRKLEHLQHLAGHRDPDSALVVVCDKIANLEDVAEDITIHKSVEVATRSFKGGLDGTRAYYRAMYDLLGTDVNPDARRLFRKLLETLLGEDPGGPRTDEDPVAVFRRSFGRA